jgi:hypothetical protein
MTKLLNRLMNFVTEKLRDRGPVVLNLHDDPWSPELRAFTALSNVGRTPVLGFSHCHHKATRGR